MTHINRGDTKHILYYSIGPNNERRIAANSTMLDPPMPPQPPLHYEVRKNYAII